MNAHVTPLFEHLEPSGEPADDHPGAVWIEVLGPHATLLVLERHRALPVTLGRARGNDVVVDAEGVADAHLRIVRDRFGVISIEPLGGEAMRIHRGPRTRLRHSFAKSSIVHVGSVTISVVDLTRAVTGDSGAPRTRHGRLRRLARTLWRRSAHSAVSVLALAAGLLGSAAADWLDSTGNDSLLDALRDHANLGYGIAAWVLAWSIATRVMGGTTRWRRHLRLAALATLAYGALAVGLPLAAAALSLREPAWWSDTLTLVTLTAAAAFALRQIPWPPGRTVAAIVVASLVGVSAIGKTVYQAVQSADDYPRPASALPVGLQAHRPEPLSAVLELLERGAAAPAAARAASGG